MTGLSQVSQFHGKVNFRLEIVSDRLPIVWYFHLRAAIGAKLIGTYRSLQVAKLTVSSVTLPHGMANISNL